MSRSFGAELSNISSVINVPGNWSKRQFLNQVAYVATRFVDFVGINCVTPRVIVTHRD